MVLHSHLFKNNAYIPGKSNMGDEKKLFDSLNLKLEIVIRIIPEIKNLLYAEKLCNHKLVSNQISLKITFFPLSL